MFLGKLMISVATCFGFYLLITYVPSIAQTIFEPVLLIIVIFILSQIVFIMAYAVSTLFMAVYSIAMDTLLACFIID